MKNWVYIALIVFGSWNMSYGQVVPWTVIPTSNSEEIVLKNIVSTANYDYKFDTNGDAIGIFYDQGGTYVCGGYIILDGITRTFKIYGNDAVDNGFQPNENFHLKYWRKDQNCIISAPSAGMTYAQYISNGSDTIFVLGAWPAIVNYPKNYYCQFDLASQNVPLQISGTTFANLTISISPPTLTGYAPATGVIEDFNGVDPKATYTFSVSTLDNKCLRYPTFDMVISNNLRLVKDITVTHPTCDLNSGTVLIDTSNFSNGTKPYFITLKDVFSGTSYPMPSGLLTEIPSGQYKLIVKDFHGCADTSQVIVTTTTNNCDEIGPILTPGQNNNTSEVYFPWEGEITVYNSQGMLMRKMNGPLTWDGTTSNGTILTTGLYIIFNNNKKVKEITVVY